jgi:hypothetical protein
MACRLTRFYYDFDEDCRTGCLMNLAFEDICLEDADEFEKNLQLQEIPYTRVDL